MGIKCGIVGLPNVGKSTLFNALTKAGIAAANFPFCTIEPNVGVVPVPDERLNALSAIVNPQKVIPTAVEFVDIAGLVAGASKGEGLGNKFLAHIREVDAIAHVVRCFEHSDIVHVAGKVDPIADIETIDTELALADLDSVDKALNRAERAAKANDKDALARKPVLQKLAAGLNEGKTARSLGLDGQLVVGRVADLLEREAVRLHDGHGGIAQAGGEHLGRPRRLPPPLADGEQTADQRAHHVVAERVRAHGRLEHAVGAPLPVQVQQPADRGRALPPHRTLWCAGVRQTPIRQSAPHCRGTGLAKATKSPDERGESDAASRARGAVALSPGARWSCDGPAFSPPFARTTNKSERGQASGSGGIAVTRSSGSTRGASIAT